ncbi:MAG: DNA (cytosine-5-)-methyltransferase [bacterium]|nr:DNA (cytosine-5-)-methyltransferase [bacterium]
MNEKFTFIDLFAGIGGFRIALESIGGRCVFSSEIDEHACEMYKANFGDDPYCDITKLDPSTIPDFDILCAGFPCQSFSICGKQKGFIDETRGTLFFDIVRILKKKRPKAFILENVKNLTTHDKGRTLTVIIDTLNNLGYSVNYKVLNAKDFGVPQNRERILIVGSKDGIHFDFNKVKGTPSKPMKEFLDTKGKFEILKSEQYTILDKKYIKQQKSSGLIFTGYLNKPIRKAGVRPNTEHLSRVHRQVNRIYSSEGMHPTIASQEVNGRFYIYNDNIVRKLTIDECYRFFGFPEDFIKIGSSAKLYERIGNSVCIPVIKAVALEVYNQFFERGENMDGKINPSQFLEDVYQQAKKNKSLDDINLNEIQKDLIKIIVANEQSNKGVFTVLVSSLTYKCLHPEQDIRYHKVDLPNGYSGRSFDTKYVTPFLKEKRFLGAMKESGWLTRSLEQLHPFTNDFPGRINKVDLKMAFLTIFDEIETENISPYDYLLGIFTQSIIEKQKRTVKVINPIDKESNIPIREIIEMLHEHFYYKYSSRGASILPVIAFYSIYECMIKHFDRFKNMELDSLGSHNSSDRSSKETGDIVVRNIKTKDIYEVVEVKFDIKPTHLMVDYAYDKIKYNNNVQRYYILSTARPDLEELNKINDKIDEIYKEYGCQVIVNGIFDSLKYYLRLLTNSDEFLTCYTKNLQANEELDYEHKISWNRIVENRKDD